MAMRRGSEESFEKLCEVLTESGRHDIVEEFTLAVNRHRDQGTSLHFVCIQNLILYHVSMSLPAVIQFACSCTCSIITAVHGSFACIRAGLIHSIISAIHAWFFSRDRNGQPGKRKSRPYLCIDIAIQARATLRY